MKTATSTPRTTSTLRNRIFRLAAALCLAFGALAPTTVLAVAPSSGVPFLDAVSDANRLTELNTNWSVFMVKGNSMEPLFGKNSLLVIEKADFTALVPGMTVVYKDAAGDFVAHRLINLTSNGWVVVGQNNDAKDPGLVTANNFQGVVFCMMHYKEGTDTLASVDPAAKPTVALAKRY